MKIKATLVFDVDDTSRNPTMVPYEAADFLKEKCPDIFPSGTLEDVEVLSDEIYDGLGHHFTSIESFKKANQGYILIPFMKISRDDFEMGGWVLKDVDVVDSVANHMSDYFMNDWQAALDYACEQEGLEEIKIKEEGEDGIK